MAVQRSQVSHQVPSVASVALSQQMAQAPGSGDRLYLSPSHRALLEKAQKSSRSVSPHATVRTNLSIEVKPAESTNASRASLSDGKVRDVAQDLIV